MSENKHYRKEWIENGRIICIRFNDVGKEAADLCYADLAELFGQWNLDRPLHLLMDVRLGNILVSSQALMRSRQVTRITGSTPGRTAVLIDNAFTAQIVSGLLRALSGERERAVFSQESIARAWLLQNNTTTTAEIKKAPPPGYEG
jgi:hypothetical protein